LFFHLYSLAICVRSSINASVRPDEGEKKNKHKQKKTPPNQLDFNKKSITIRKHWHCSDFLFTDQDITGPGNRCWSSFIARGNSITRLLTNRQLERID